MKGDYTRSTFDASKPYSSVRLQQGRVLLDADWNEQQEINEYRETTTNKEIIGDGGSAELESFKVKSITDEEIIELGEGICYVEGIQCEHKASSEEEVLSLEENKTAGDYLIYLEVWQHHRTAIEDENLREKALGGPDTTTRTQTHWQVKGSKIVSKQKWLKEWEEILSANSPKGKLEVQSTAGSLGNDLYRVEIHKVKGQDDDGGGPVPETTFKWARNNGAIAARVEAITTDGTIVTIKSNPQAQFAGENWIEINSEERELAGLPGYFAKIDSVEENNRLILNDEDNELKELSPEEALDPQNQITTARLWGDEAKKIASDDSIDDGYITLEKDLKIKFEDDEEKYRTGDYWLIPTRSQEAVVWDGDGEEPHGIDYYYCPLAIAHYSSTGGWEVVKDCRKVFPALTEVLRETAVTNGDEDTIGTSLSLGVHSYNDSRRASDPEKAEHTDDKLDIQGGKQLKLNVGYWQDELGGALPDVPDAAMSFCVNDREVMSLDKDELRLEESVSINKGLAVAENLTVTGTSHLQGAVSIGVDPPEEAIGLKVKPALEVPEVGGSEVVGLKLEPTLTARNSGDRLTGLHIKPDFKENRASELKKYGLIVEKGKVGIGSALNAQGNISIGVDVRPEVIAKDAGDKLVGLHIKPNFDNSYQGQVERYGLMVEEGKVGIGSQALAREEDQDKLRVGVDVQPKVIAKDPDDRLVGLYIKPEFKECCGIDDGAKYGLIVEEGKVAIGPKKNSEYPVEIDGEASRVKNLTVTGTLEVYGQVTQHAEKDEAGDIYLGQQNEDGVIVHASLSTAHTSDKLKVTSPLEIELTDVTDTDKQDFLSLFSTNASDVNGRIVWKKGTVTEPGEEYAEEATEVAAIYSTVKGDGREGDLRFGTSDGTLADRMVITADGKVGIGTDSPGTNQLKVTGTTSLEDLVVENGLTVTNGGLIVENADTNMESLVLSGAGNRLNPTLKVPEGNVCIGAEEIPRERLRNNLSPKLYVKGNLVSFDAGLSVFGSTDIETLTVTPDLAASGDDQSLIAVKIDPTFNIKKNGGDYQNVKQLGLHVVSGDVAIAAGGMAIGSDDPAGKRLNVTGQTQLNGDLTVASGNVDIASGMEIGGTLDVTGDSTLVNAILLGTLGVEGDSTLVNAILLGTLGVEGDSTLVNATLSGTLDVTGNSTLSNLTTSGKVAIGSDVVDGTHQLKVTGGTTTDTLTVTGGTTTDTLTVTGTFNPSSLTTGGNGTIGGNAEIGGNATIGGTLEVTGESTLSNLAVSGNLTAASGNVAIDSAAEGESEIVFPSATKSKIQWESSGNESDFAYIFYKDQSKYSRSRAANVGSQVDTQDVTDYDACRRLSIGIGNETKNYENQDALDIQGASCLTLNVGKWDLETSEEFGDQTNGGDPVGISFRVHDEQKMLIAPNGAVGIGKVPGTATDPIVDEVKLDVAGKVKANDVELTSDGMLKENIHTLKDGLGKILGLRGVTYKWKEEEAATQEATEIGLVAQEVEEIFPELVSTDSQGMKSLSYSKLIAPLIEAVKEQQGQILGLVQQVQQQQAQIEQLQALNNG
ncbi:MAG: DUF6519 domain-containing protein [Hormoscilla sp.]